MKKLYVQNYYSLPSRTASSGASLYAHWHAALIPSDAYLKNYPN